MGMPSIISNLGINVTSKFSWRKVLAVPAILSLALGGALLAAAPANAAEAGLIVTAPANGATTASRTVTVSGSVFGGSVVIVYAADGTTELARTNPGGELNTPTPYSVVLPVYADDASAAQTIKVGGLYGGSGIPQRTVNFTLPAVAPVFAVTSPTEGETLTSRTVVFSGTGTDGSTVNVLDADGDRIPGTEAAVVSDGTWTTTGTYPDDAAVAQTVYVNQVTGGAGRGEQTVNFTLPPTLLPAPVITSPTNGQIVTGATVTFTGTGTPDTNVLLLVVPTDLLNQPTARAAAPADPTDPILVDAAGNWTVTLALAPEDYTAAAALVELNEQGELVGIISEPSADVAFTLVAAAAAPVTPAGSVTPGTSANTGSSNKNQLASTGSAPAGLIGIASLMALAGAATLILRKKASIN
jgi:hypothetical protein